MASNTIEIPITFDIRQEAADFAVHVLTMWLNKDESRDIGVIKSEDGTRKVITKVRY